MPTETLLPGLSGLFARNWWALLLRGVLAIVLGFLMLTRPGMTLATLMLVFGVYAICDGISALITAISGWSHRDDRWWLLMEAFVGIWAGLVILRTPQITGVVLIFLIAFWALAIGVLRIAEAIRMQSQTSGEVWLALSGIVSVSFALLVTLRPMVGAVALEWLIGGYAIFLGIAEIVLGFRLRRIWASRYRLGEVRSPHRRVA